MNTGNPQDVPQDISPPDRFDSLGWVFVLSGLCISVVFGLLSDGLYMNDDATHFFIARGGFTDLTYLLHRWGRVGYTLPTAPIAYWFGFTGCRIFSAVQTALLAFLAWRTARRLIGPGLAAASAALLVWLQPLTFLLSMTSLTETTGALYMLLALFLYIRGNRLLSCAAFSALFLARDETPALAPLIVAALLMDAHREAGGNLRRTLRTWWVWVGSILLIAGPVLYVLATLPVDLPPEGDPLQIFSRRYSAEYGTGPLYWMTARWCEQATPGIVVLGLLGAGFLIRAVWRREPLVPGRPLPAGAWMIAAWMIAYAALHSVLFHRGLFAHGGEGRYMVPIGGLTAVLGAVGLRGMFTNTNPRGWILWLYAILLMVLTWLPLLMFPFLWDAPTVRYGVPAATVLLVLVAALPLFRRAAYPKQTPALLLAVALMLTLGQLRVYFRPLSLENPIDPMDRLVAQAVRCIEAENLSQRPVIANHPLVRFLLPSSQLLATTADALAQWRADPPGTIFVWDSKNGNWPDPAEREANALLLETLQSQSVSRRRFTHSNQADTQRLEVIVFEKQ